MSTPISYFERMYAADPDPWSFETRWYDARKHALTVDALPARRYRSGFEPGCSTGLLTSRLAARCDRLLATDAVGSAVQTAAARLADRPHVTIRTGQLPRDWPDETFDLIVLSELAYYFDDTDLATLLHHAANSLTPPGDLAPSGLAPNGLAPNGLASGDLASGGLVRGGDLVAVHWRHPVAEHARSGDEVHAALAAVPGLHRISRHEEADFLLEVFTRDPLAASVARREGLV
ncbi:SAM-dependent methyltransferase [Actinoplanes awajinensis]|uniref:SAM-dependent methyltransferase n=1 Tax=Actinoplanes awajinensis subsp. mycoplanecinus TaxID=135947 RepID=A0A117MLB4_9ACTN|nr:SAM-dependent methyltransferase [Actinoplanes awajinensis]KUL23712.1 SAM-dependent methyltransferase [Actinoplanes awajinensis subsp. mycoplanecinus]